MRKVTNLFILGVALAIALSGCGPSSSPTAEPDAPIISPTPESPTLTPVVPTATITPIPKGKTIIVTTADDRGPGTFRQALYDAQPGDTITFDQTVFPPENPTTIFLKNEDQESALPEITQDGITIDASNAGVILDGGNLSGDWVMGLEIYSDGNIIQGLQIINFSGPGITIDHASYNMIGGDRNDGTGLLGRGNLISKNGYGIVFWESGSNNTITGNIIGTDYTESYDWGNKMNGIYFKSGWTHNNVGPNNIVANNGSVGILITGTDSFGNTVTQNSIYDNAFGIRLDDSNTMLAHPLISEFDIVSGTVSGSACANCIIEIYSTSNIDGEIYEGSTRTDSKGMFTYEHGIPFAGPFITATATDGDGNTSELGQYYPLFQGSNYNPITNLQTKQSNALNDNKIGIHFTNLWRLEPEVFPDGVLNADHILNQGETRARFAINNIDSEIVYWDKPENMIEPSHDEFITTLADNGIKITYVLSFWDKEYVAQGGDIYSPRFKTEDEILRYLDYVRFIVSHFKDRVDYFEIWNEPNIENTIQWIEVDDYINLVQRTIPVIRQEYPEAKIVVGGVAYIREQYVYDYLLGILESDDIMPYVDGISWHGMYGTSPEYDFHRQYYYDYPAIVREIKETASAHGFTGEYISDELSWLTPATSGYPETYYSETKAAKYYARGIIMHLGMDVIVSQFYAVPNAHPYLIVDTIRNLSTIMAGTEPTELAFEIQSDATYIQSYTFSLPNGDTLIAVWNDDVAVDYDLGIASTLTLPGYAGQTVTGIDVLYGFNQDLVSSNENGDLVIHDFLLKDYPIFIRLSK